MDNLKNIISNIFNTKFTNDTISKISNILHEFADKNEIPQDQKTILKEVNFNKFMIDMIDKDMIDKDKIDTIKEGAPTWASLFNDVYNHEPNLQNIDGMKTFMKKIKNLIEEADKNVNPHDITVEEADKNVNTDDITVEEADKNVTQKEVTQQGAGKSKKRKGKVGGKSKKKRGSRKR